MHHYECAVPNVDINLQSVRFWATSIPSFRERFIDFRSCWVVFIHVVRGRCLAHIKNKIDLLPVISYKPVSGSWTASVKLCWYLAKISINVVRNAISFSSWRSRSSHAISPSNDNSLALLVRYSFLCTLYMMCEKKDCLLNIVHAVFVGIECSHRNILHLLLLSILWFFLLISDANISNVAL